MKDLTIGRTLLSDSWVAVSVQGEIDLATVEQLDREVRAVLEDDGLNLVIDLTEASFMDSTGLKLLVTTDRDFAQAGRKFAIAVKPGPIARLVDLSGVDSSLTIVSDVKDLVGV